jgi:hypothetical protein
MKRTLRIIGASLLFTFISVVLIIHLWIGQAVKENINMKFIKH